MRAKIEKNWRFLFVLPERGWEKEKGVSDEARGEKASGNRSCRLILGQSSFVERLLPPDETLLESNPRNAAV